MVMTPAKRHAMRMKAKQEASYVEASGATRADATQYELQLAQLATHKHQLKQLQSVERKIDLKRQILPEYLPYLQGVLESGAGAQDDVLMTMMVWAVDVGELALALRIGEYALAHGLTTPEQYQRDTATLLAEEIAESQQATTDDLIAIAELTADHDMPDEVRAKLHKAIGLGLAEVSIPAALEHLRRALQLHERVGVKKDLERLERELKKQQPEPNPAPEQ